MDCARDLGRYGDTPFTRTKVFTGAVPFCDKPSRAVMSAVVGGERPSRSTYPVVIDKP